MPPLSDADRLYVLVAFLTGLMAGVAVGALLVAIA